MISRRNFAAGAAAAACLRSRANAASAAPVAIQRCRTYGAGLEPVMRRLFDGIGGLGRIVNNKTIAIKINLTSRPGPTPSNYAHWTHPRVVAMTAFLMNEAGARRIRILESPGSTTTPLEQYLAQANWDTAHIRKAAKIVEFENTNAAPRYARLTVPNGGQIFPACDLHPAYADCDVFVSIAKLKENASAGLSLSMKNAFGITPIQIYGDASTGARIAVLHNGTQPPAAGAPAERHPLSPRHAGYRVPRIVADLCAARPIHLAILDGVHSIAGGEGPWVRGTRPCSPGVLIAGTNPVATDAVATAVLGFDPMAERGAPPFENCDNTMALAEEHGMGTRDLSKIEVAGAQIADIRYEIRKA